MKAKSQSIPKLCCQAVIGSLVYSLYRGDGQLKNRSTQYTLAHVTMKNEV